MVVAPLAEKLRNPATTLPEKYRVLFSVKGVPGTEAFEALAQALQDESVLFRHEVAYCLGQRRSPEAIKLLALLLGDLKEHSMVRHEAGEALGAIGTPECVSYLEVFQHDSSPEVAQTCQLALQRIAFYSSADNRHFEDESKYLSVDPAPAFPGVTPREDLEAIITNDAADIFSRYRALFALRNQGGDGAIQTLGACFRSNSALLKHEIAYVLGQMQDKRAVPILRQVLCDPNENAMVRHEAAEALGAIAEPQCIELLKAACSDPEPVVADSCVVALDMLQHELSGAFQYAEVAS